MNKNVVKVVEAVFGTAHLATAILGEAIALGEAKLLSNTRELIDTDGEVKTRNIKENISYRKWRSMKRRQELFKVVSNPVKKMQEIRKEQKQSKTVKVEMV